MRAALVLAGVLSLAAGPQAPPEAAPPPGPSAPPPHGASAALPPGHPHGEELGLRLALLERLDARDAAGTLEAMRALLAVSPRSSDDWRVAAFIYRGLGRWAEAEEALGEAVRWAPDASSAMELLAERAEVRKARGLLEAAEDDLHAVLGVRPAHPLALQLGVEVALARGQPALARERLRVLEGTGGQEVPLLRARLLDAEGDAPGALAWARRAARESGPRDTEAARLVVQLEEAARAARTRPVLRVLAGLGALVGLLVAVLVVAFPLAFAQRRRLVRRAPGSAPRPGPAAAVALQVASWGMGGLVLALPLLVLAPVAWPLAVLSVVWPAPGWLALALLLCAPALATCVAWARVLGTRTGVGEAGVRLLSEAHPHLFAELQEAARQAGAPLPTRVQLAADTTLHAGEDGPTWRLLLGRGEWTLVLGLARLVGTPRAELRALLVEALGPAGGGGLLRVQARTALALRALRQALRQQPLGLANPYLHALALLSDLYAAVRDGVRPAVQARVEVRAARAAGGTALLAARARAGWLRRRHDRVANRLVPTLVRAGHPVADLYPLLAACEEVLQAPGTPPAPAPEGDAVLSAGELLGVARAGTEVPHADAAGVELLEGADALTQALTRAWVERLRAGLAAVQVAVAPPATAAPGREVARCVTLARFDEALAQRRAGAAGAEEAVHAALAGLEAEVGPRDALLGLCLKELAQVEALRGEHARAVRTLERALQTDGARCFRGLLEEWRRVA